MVERFIRIGYGAGAWKSVSKASSSIIAADRVLHTVVLDGERVQWMQLCLVGLFDESVLEEPFAGVELVFGSRVGEKDTGMKLQSTVCVDSPAHLRWSETPAYVASVYLPRASL